MTTFRSESPPRPLAPGWLAPTLAVLSIASAVSGAMAESRVPSPMPGSSEPISVPSGQAMTLVDIVLDAPGPDGAVARYRFLAPAIARVGGTIGFPEAAADLQFLCDRLVVPDLARQGALPGTVILSASDREVAFGESDPEATQFFTAFQIIDTRCILEPF